jgi:multidrug transporter EmrE-like cation transporter
MGYLLDINNLLAENSLALSSPEVTAITAVINNLLEDLALQTLSVGVSYTNHGAAGAILAANSMATIIRDKKVTS